MTSKTETILQTLFVELSSNLTTACLRNAAVPEIIPTQGLVILRDGNPGEAETALGGFGVVYYSHEVEIEIYVAEGDQGTRDTQFDQIITNIGIVLDQNPDLNGLIYGITVSRPDVSVEGITGAHAIKSGVMSVIVDYETSGALM